MATDFFVITLLVASLAAFVFLWLKLRQVETKLDVSARGLTEVGRVVQSECLPALTESSRRIATVLDRLDAERSSAEAELAKSKDSMTPLLDELTRASSQLAEVRVELARLIDRATARPADDASRAQDPAWLRELVRAHLIGLGIGSVSFDGLSARDDGAQVVRARGLRGNELWTGSVIVRGGKVESASALTARMFP